MPYVNYNKVTDWTKEKILEKLTHEDVWVEHAILALHARQTEWERRVLQTVNDNDIGFQPADARWFSKFANQIMARAESGIPEGQRLSPRQFAYCRRPWHRGKRVIPAIAKYRGQLLEMIEAKAKAKLLEGVR
jgi:hypothetical protein